MSKTELIIAGIVVVGVAVYTVKKLNKRNSDANKVIKEVNNTSAEQEEFVSSEVELDKVKEQVQKSGEEQSEDIKNRHQKSNTVMKSSLENIFNDNTEATSSSIFKEIENDLEDLLN